MRRGTDECACCGMRGDWFTHEWNGIMFCSCECQTMYALERAEYEYEWQRDELVLQHLDES